MERRKGSDASSSSASVTPSPDYEVMMKLTELRSEKRPLEMDNELRLLLTHYLDDSFTVFNHITKAMLCQRAAELYDMAGFKRKRAFYLRLSVLFQLHGYSTVDITRTVSDYKVVYPILLRTLRGYSIRNLSHEAARSFVFNAARLGPAEIQIRALHELFMAAQRAEEYDAALRHVCYLLQVYLNVMEDGGLKSIGEMQKMLAYRATKTDTPPSLSTIVQPAAAPGVRLPPLIFSRFPLFSDWKPKPLEEHLRPHAVSPTQPRLFVYCAFEDRSSQSEAVVWVVDCPSFIVVQVTNPSPVALRIDDLRLRLAGCDADAQPVNFSLEPGEKREERIPVVPRSEGELRLCGYAWSVFGIRTAADAASLAPDCDRPLYIEGDDELDCDGELTGGSEDPIMTVEVLPSLPTVEITSSLLAATSSNEHCRRDSSEPSSLVEVAVFTGQTVDHWLNISVKRTNQRMTEARLLIDQPVVRGGPQLVEWRRRTEGADADAKRNDGDQLTELLQHDDTSQLQLGFHGIDPAATSLHDANTDDTSASGRRGGNVEDDAEDRESGGEGDQEDSISRHDVLPYEGRLLNVRVRLRYAVTTQDNREWIREQFFDVLVRIRPALVVRHWRVVAGPSALSRFVCVDMKNWTGRDMDVEYKTESNDGKVLGVSAGETARLTLLVPVAPLRQPLLAPSNVSNHSTSAQHRRQMEDLRRAVEVHLMRHMQVDWRFSTLSESDTDGGESTPNGGRLALGRVLASPRLLQHMLLPSLSLQWHIQGCSEEGDEVQVAVGQPLRLRITLLLSLTESVQGAISLHCYQPVQSSTAAAQSALSDASSEWRGAVARSDVFVALGARRLAFQFPASSPSLSSSARQEPPPITAQSMLRRIEVQTAFMFRTEGVFRLRPLLAPTSSPALLHSDLFFSPLVFSVSGHA